MIEGIVMKELILMFCFSDSTIHDDDERILMPLRRRLGYLLKNTRPGPVDRSVKEATRRRAHVAEVARADFAYFARPAADRRITTHAARNQDFELLVEGQTMKPAAKARVKPTTIISICKKIYQKLQVHSKTKR